MANKHMERSLITREMQRPQFYYYKPIRTVKVKNGKNKKCWQECKESLWKGYKNGKVTLENHSQFSFLLFCLI
jgi:hypothetical protein